MNENEQRTAGIAITSLVLGILSLTLFAVIGPILSIPAIICGHVGMSRIKKNPDILKGQGIALAGTITGYVQIGLTIIMLPLMAAIAIPSFVKARETAQRNACINNMLMIDSGKEQWALSERIAAGQSPDVAGVNAYLKGNTTPICPTGGKYEYNAIGEDPACTTHGSMSEAMQAYRHY